MISTCSTEINHKKIMNSWALKRVSLWFYTHLYKVITPIFSANLHLSVIVVTVPSSLPIVTCAPAFFQQVMRLFSFSTASNPFHSSEVPLKKYIHSALVKGGYVVMISQWQVLLFLHNGATCELDNGVSEVWGAHILMCTAEDMPQRSAAASLVLTKPNRTHCGISIT